jgi:hypothetical protein
MDKQLKHLKESWKKLSEKEKLKGGKADGKTLQDIVDHHGGKVTYDSIKHQLEMGLKVEKEHTDDPAEAREVAEDHLWEDPEYYTKLAAIHKD